MMTTCFLLDLPLIRSRPSRCLIILLEICPLPFDEFGSKAVIGMMQSMDYLPSLGLGRRQ